MKIVVALDKFKGSLTAPEACEIVRRALPATAEIIVKPMADGGDGTADALHAALGGEWISKRVAGPLPETFCTAKYLWLANERRAFIEMAQASGLVLLKPEQRNPLLTTTYGTGELMADAIRRGAERIWLAVGGSATTDGGIGVAAALGWQFLDATGKPVNPVGGELERIVTLHALRSTLPPVDVLCDVDNPLCGEHGAARVFGPQKGATPAMVEQLDNGLRHLAGLVKAQLGKDILNVPGAGAAGGLGGGAIAFLNARLVPGIETVMTASRPVRRAIIARQSGGRRGRARAPARRESRGAGRAREAEHRRVAAGRHCDRAGHYTGNIAHGGSDAARAGVVGGRGQRLSAFLICQRW